MKFQNCNDAIFKITCAILATAIGFFAIYTSLNPAYATSFNEYYFKYLPALINGNFYTIFDGGLLGDPRPRTFSTLLTLANIHLRELLYSRDIFLPSIGVNWLIYPASIFAIYKATLKAFKSTNVALASSVIFASSPAALNMLCDFYIPAKPLALLFTITSIGFFGSLLELQHDSRALLRRLLAIFGLWISSFLCMLSDETGIFIPLFLLAIYFKEITIKNINYIFKLFLICIFPYLIYFIYSFYVLPLINNQLDQVILNPIDIAINGIFPAIFEFSPTPLWSWHFNSFLSLFENIISSFLLPAKESTGGWTSLKYFGLLSFDIQYQIIFSIAVFSALYFYLNVNANDRQNVIRLLFGFIVFCFIESYVLKALTPYLIETNYYANQGSIWISLVLGLLLGGISRIKPYIRALGLIVVTLITITNFSDSIRRNPFITTKPPTFKEIKDILSSIKEEKFIDISSRVEYPTSQYKFAFEMEIYRRHLSGEIIDLAPRSLNKSSIINSLPIKGVQDELLRDNFNFLQPIPISSKSLKPISLETFPSLITDKKVIGISGDWNYIRTYNSHNSFNEKVWFQGIVRIWNLNGSYLLRNGSVCFFYSNLTEECLTALFINSQNQYFGFDSEGRLVTRFLIDNRQ
ncbi:hypothetical protein [Polynucleobacter sp. IMCC 29146]|uniref:hypothetical protein n=1 Tax=Polynucleobacter sp. IMCC 29146 TaxID=2780953 RepID=UPI001F3FE150|nr:hypothetical protein [Polynucleobacter sp. IMCC 29146]